MDKDINIETILKNHPNASREQLIPILQDVQDAYGYVPEESIVSISKHLKLSATNIFGVATFYNQFRFTPKGKYHIRICYGTACHVLGSSTELQELEKMLKIKDGGRTRDGLFSLEVQSCIGGCGQAPVLAINDHYYPKVTFEFLKKTIQAIRKAAEQK
jgi:NADH:ubiquinone oxidoreductase subunit E